MIDPVTSVMEPGAGSGATGASIAAAAGTGIISRRGLFELPGHAGHVTLVSVPAGSEKTVLLPVVGLRAVPADRAVSVPVPGQRRDPQQVWISVEDAPRGTTAGAELARPLTAADLDGWAVMERLLDGRHRCGSIRPRPVVVQRPDDPAVEAPRGEPGPLERDRSPGRYCTTTPPTARRTNGPST